MSRERTVTSQRHVLPVIVTSRYVSGVRDNRLIQGCCRRSLSVVGGGGGGCVGVGACVVVWVVGAVGVVTGGGGVQVMRRRLRRSETCTSPRAQHRQASRNSVCRASTSPTAITIGNNSTPHVSQQRSGSVAVRVNRNNIVHDMRT